MSKKNMYAVAYDLLKDGKRVFLTGFDAVPDKVVQMIVKDQLKLESGLPYATEREFFTEEQLKCEREVRSAIAQFIANENLVFIMRNTMTIPEFESVVSDLASRGITDVVIDNYEYIMLNSLYTIHTFAATIGEKYKVRVYH